MVLVSLRARTGIGLRNVAQQDELPVRGDAETGRHRGQLGLDRDRPQAAQQGRRQARAAGAAQGGAGLTLGTDLGAALATTVEVLLRAGRGHRG